jgi:class 3 adenylate cyclase/tetratricopeptide (TPR) repeat protein
MPEPRETWVDAVVAAERRGELLSAFDLAERGLEEYPDDVWLRHRAVLALARAGSTDEAQRRFDDYELASVDEEDAQALQARIAKDVALAAQGVERREEARRAAMLYGEIFDRTGGYYPGVNAATLKLVAGDAAEARLLAERALTAIAAADPLSYYAAASEAEALLVLGRPAEARQALERTASLYGGDHGALSTTRRQLRLICRESGLDDELLSAIAGPSVVHYCGHRIAPLGGEGRFPADAEQLVRARIVAEIERDRPGFAYGSLANGADILFAEALLAVGAELHLVFPFAVEEFVESSVADGGAGWVERFQTCLAAATSVSYATDDAFLGDDVLYRYASELAMGLAVLRARFLDAPLRQIAVWDGRPARGEAGTAVDVARWRRHGRPTTTIAPTDLPAPTNFSPPATARSGDTPARVVRALLFSDIKAFSRLTDEQLPRFATHVLGALATALDKHRDAIEYRETWGDAIYAVLTDPVSAAACALDLQDAMAGLNLAALRLPGHLALRLGGHVGPVFPVRNPIMDSPAFMGSHVSRTARIEPVTPPGSVFVTEQFAAALTLENSPFGCDYVGHIPAAKDLGRLRMYRLRRGVTAAS